VFAILIAVLGGIGVVIGAIVAASQSGRGIGQFFAVLIFGALYVGVVALFMFAYAEIIRLVIAVEDNTRLTAEALAGRAANSRNSDASLGAKATGRPRPAWDLPVPGERVPVPLGSRSQRLRLR
jgi:hypothetical protein